MKKLLLAILLMACACPILAQAPSDVPKDHWAYEAVKALIDKGYLVGYPDGKFMGKRPLTRYEFATVVKRLLDDVAARIEAAKAAQAPTGQEPPPPINAPAPVTGEDLAKLQKLIEEFKPELVVIGARIDKLEQSIEAVKTTVSALKKVNVSGYVQVRYDTFQADLNNPAPGAKPPSNFDVRRARVKVTGKPTEKSMVVVQLDAGENYQGTTPVVITLKDAYLEYAFTGDPTRGISMQMGQMKWPFGYEIPQSTFNRESPERTLISQRLFPGERDRGFYGTWPLLNGKAVWKVGVFNGVPTTQTPSSDAKAGVTTARLKLRNLDIGASAWFGKQIEGISGLPYYGNNDPKTRYGADAEWYLKDLSLKVEYIVGRGVDGADASMPLNGAVLHTSVNGGWAQAAWDFAKSNTLAVKYETMSEDPLLPQYGRRSAWDLGLLRWLDCNSRVKLYYIINQEQDNSFANNAYIAEWIMAY